MNRAMLRVMPLLLVLAGCGDDDAGNDNHNQNANANQSTLCGNGALEGAEECDHGAENSDLEPDGCRTDCRLAYCGDSVADTGEACDDGPQNSDVVPDACRTTCTVPRCGDGVADVAHGEGCDCGDGTGPLPGRCTLANSDAEGASCRPDCRPAGCGDGMLQGDELCDASLLGESSCRTFGYYQGQIACTEACSYDLSDCHDHCNDGVVNDAAEVCDTDPPLGKTCLSYGFDHGRLGCSSWCTPGFDDCGALGFQSVYDLSLHTFIDLWQAGDDDVFVLYSENGSGTSLVGRFTGGTWTPMPLPAGTPILSHLRGVSATAVFAVGSPGPQQDASALRFDGTSWIDLQVPAGYDLRDVWPTGSDEAIFVGQEASTFQAVALTWSGGTFTPTVLPGGAGFAAAYRIWGAAPDAIYVGGSRLARHNGTSWEAVALPETMTVDALWSATATDVYVGGHDSSGFARLYRYDGSVWTRVEELAAIQSPILSVWGSSDRDVFVNLQYGDTYHLDGGFWTPVAQGGDPVSLVGITGTGPRDVWAVGVEGLLRYRGFGWSTRESFADQQLHGLAGRSASELYAVGGLSPNGEVWRRTTSGWSSATPPAIPVPLLRSAWTAAGEPLWIAGGNAGGSGSVLKRTTVWSTVTLPASTPPLTGLHGLPGGSVFAVGGNVQLPYDQGVALRCTGTTCSATTLPVGTPWLVSVWAAAENDAFAVGMNGTILRFNGTSWTAMTSPAAATENLKGVWGASVSAVWAVSASGRIYFFDGLTWEEQPSGATQPLRAIWGRSASDVWATGNEDTVLHFDGVAWSTVRSSLAGYNVTVWGHASAVLIAGWSMSADGHLVQLVGEGSL